MTPISSTAPDTGIGSKVQKYLWNWQNQTLPIVYETLGEGTPVLLLPSFSTVSTREEMGELARSLASQYQVTTLDWLGFGESARPSLDYRPELYRQLLQDFVKDTFTQPIPVVAAGHAAGYALQLPQAWSKIVLAAPTWRGPLPTMGASPQIATGLRQLVRSPILGQALYKLNTTPSFLRLMYRRHVYTDRAKLTPEFIKQKWNITQRPGARYAPAAFVTGNLDPVNSQAEFLALFQSISVPVLVVVGEQSPPKSKAEMEVLGNLTGVEIKALPGSLGLHEEYASQLGEMVEFFLTDR